MTALNIWLLLCMCLVAMAIFEFAFLLALQFGGDIKWPSMGKDDEESGHSTRIVFQLKQQD
jgi:hypothetical protein